MTFNSDTTVEKIIEFLQKTFADAGKTKGIVAVSGGIDSAVSLTLLTRAIGAENVYPLMLPYADQSTEDSQSVIEFNKIPSQNWQTIDIQPIVKGAELAVGQASDQLRKGNIMARARMIVVYDVAKRLDALVCGTENKSEMYLGYFTRFGDEASDIEPIQHLFKTEVRAVAAHLDIPTAIQTKAPSAGLWQGQTDEKEMGFTYEDADKVLAEYERLGHPLPLSDDVHARISSQSGVDRIVTGKVLDQVEAMHFKHVVPYTIT